MMDIVTSIRTGSDSKILFVRYNPDSFSIDGKKQKVSREERETKLLELIQKYSPHIDLSIHYLFYDLEDNLPTYYNFDFQPVREFMYVARHIMFFLSLSAFKKQCESTR
jgi:hypothetical protein